MLEIIRRAETHAHRDDSWMAKAAGHRWWARSALRPAALMALSAVLVTVSLQTGTVSAQQPSYPPDPRSAVLGLASQGQFQSADKAIELELASAQPDYELFWEYLHFLVNQTDEEARAARLGEKWLPAIRQHRPPALGRILKETGVAILFGRFRETHSSEDYTSAKVLLEEAIETNPQVTEAHLHLALLASLEGRAAASLSLLGRAVETSTDRAQREQFAIVRDRAKREEGYLSAIARRMYNMDS